MVKQGLVIQLTLKSYFYYTKNSVRWIFVKKSLISLGALICLLAITATPALAQPIQSGINFGPTANINPITRWLPIINTTLNWLAGLLITIFVGTTLYGGFYWLRAEGKKDKLFAAKKMIFIGIVGTIIGVVAYAIISFALEQAAKALVTV